MSVATRARSSEGLPWLYQKIKESFVNDDGFIVREQILKELNEIAITWVEKTAEHKGLKESHKKAKGTRIIPFGGHCHKVVMKDGDIDVICIAPNCVTFEDFFGSFAEELHLCSKVRQLRLVRGARVPIIKFTYDSIKIDICLAIVNRAIIEVDLDLFKDDVMIGMDSASRRSLNGLRETQELKKLLPDYNIYCTLLKVVKLWATAQGIHSSAIGYLGGMALSLLAAKVCQLHPEAVLFDLLQAFFDIFSKWNWPEPVLLLPLQCRDPFNLKPWNPKVNRADTFHLMPIIKPFYPELNCSSAVTSSGRTVITRALVSASSVLRQQTWQNDRTYELLLQPFPFLSCYKSGLVEPRIRLLVSKLESKSSIQLIHAWPIKYTSPHGHQCSWFCGLQLIKGQAVHLDLTQAMKTWHEELLTRAKSLNIYEDGMSVHVQHLRRKDLGSRISSENELKLE